MKLYNFLFCLLVISAFAIAGPSELEDLYSLSKKDFLERFEFSDQVFDAGMADNVIGARFPIGMTKDELLVGLSEFNRMHNFTYRIIENDDFGSVRFSRIYYHDVYELDLFINFLFDGDRLVSSRVIRSLAVLE